MFVSDDFEPQQIFRSFDEISLANILVVGFVAWALIMIVQRGIPWIAERLPARFRLYLLPLVPVIRLLVLGVAVAEIVTILIEPTPQNLLAIAGALAVAIGFAFKDYASAIIAGVVAIYEQPYRLGDWVQIGSDYGEVRSVGLRALKIVTPDDTMVTIPHSRIWTDNIANANNGSREHMVIAEFYITPGHDAELVRRVLHDVATTSPYTHVGRPIVVIVFERPWATHYRLKAYPIDGRNEFLFISDMTVKGKEALQALGINFANLPPAYMEPDGSGAYVSTQQANHVTR